MLGAVNLDKEKNLDNQEKEKVYAPVEFRFLSEKNEKVQQLSVGEKFKLLFFLDDDSVYTSLLLMNCSANNTNPENPKVYKILEDACPTRAGKNVIYYDYGQSKSKFTSEKGTEHNAAEIMLKAFKFVDSDRVAFSCGVRICKRGDEALCEIPDCAAGEKPAAPKKTDPAAATDPADTSAGVPADQGAPDAGTVAKRKKRSASSSNTEERTISGIIEIIDPIQREPSRDNQEKQEGDCFRSRDIIIVIIVMAAFVLTLLIACIVLAITVTKTRSRVNNMISESNGHSFFIPRAKITA
ncbi:hypothetical protein KUTeg_015181 [Tegillarca granosa]|uniref:ZP domain-containing protein n=1 Tax=Tegillarca granosa TaxID=220873 RepID=A0ABQ9ET13_TEGGR|nr:hypothetical protein KUTeg_015181 [Tegillarca granosa]